MIDHMSCVSAEFCRQRRLLLKTLALGAAALLAPWPVGAASETTVTAKPDAVMQVSPHLLVYRGPVNVGIVRDGNRALLIDCGGGDVAGVLAKHGIAKVEQILLTHYHRDQLCGTYDLAGSATITAPVEEREYLENPASYWNDETQLFRVYRSFRPDHLMPTRPLKVSKTVAEGDLLGFGPAKIHVLKTPGHTEGAVSYLVEVDGKRTVFTGDCIYDNGQIWDLHSLQRGFKRGKRQIGGYHGFMGDRWRLAESLTRIKGLKAQLLVPAHGNPMSDPARAVDTLLARLETCYENYVSISALRHYFPELFTEYAGKPGQMPIRPGIEPPDCLRHIGTTWILVSRTGAALVMDVGSNRVVDQLKKMLADGEIKSIDGLWVTHYHYDHTAGIPLFQQQFDCPCIVDRRLAQVLTRPTAWRLPCLAAETTRVDQATEDGQSWQWQEYILTANNFPGQTLYHDALLVEAGELRMLFVGDSHTMAGIDDYCAQNRNWLGRGVGFQYCLCVIEKLKPTHIFNCHVADAFTFTAEEIRFMRQQLDRREKLFTQLLPWDHANYGTDASWVRADPYTQQAKAGATVPVELVITNHSTTPQPCSCRAVATPDLGPSDGLGQGNGSPQGRATSTVVAGYSREPASRSLRGADRRAAWAVEPAAVRRSDRGCHRVGSLDTVRPRVRIG